MRGRLTVDKVNAAVNDMATYAEANAQLIVVPKKKVHVKFSFWFKKHIENHHFTYKLYADNEYFLWSWQRTSGKRPW